MTVLTKEQVAERRKGIGGSDAKRIMDGDWHSLWMVKTGRAEEPKVLSDWDAALRHAAEPLILDWYERETGGRVIERGLLAISLPHPFLRCNLDGVAERGLFPIDAKFLSVWTPGDGMAWALEKYTWQIYHQAICIGAERGMLAVSLACKAPEFLPIEVDPFAAENYIDRAREFWGFVERDEEPTEGRPAIAPPAPPPLKVVDLSRDNRWAMFAADWLANEQGAKVFDAAVKGLKSCVEPDVARAFGGGVEIKRDKRGLSIKRSG